MTDLDAALADTVPEPVTAITATTPHHVHDWTVCTCGARRDLDAPRKGRSARRLGGDTERRIQKLYGPRKVGQFGSAIDLEGRVWKWQSKATRDAPSAWLREVRRPVGHVPPTIVTESEYAMRALRQDLRPLVIQSFITAGRPTIDRIWVRCEDWRGEHGIGCGLHPAECWEWLVMDGGYFLNVHGLDRP